MKVKRMSRFLMNRVSSGSCGCCGNFAFIGLIMVDKQLICYNCLRLVIKFIGLQFGGNGGLRLGRPKHKHFKSHKKFRGRPAKFTPSELSQMGAGAKVKEARRIRDPHFSWVDPDLG